MKPKVESVGNTP